MDFTSEKQREPAKCTRENGLPAASQGPGLPSSTSLPVAHLSSGTHGLHIGDRSLPVPPTQSTSLTHADLTSLPPHPHLPPNIAPPSSPAGQPGLFPDAAPDLTPSKAMDKGVTHIIMRNLGQPCRYSSYAGRLGSAGEFARCRCSTSASTKTLRLNTMPPSCQCARLLTYTQQVYTSSQEGRRRKCCRRPIWVL